jgi:Transposase
VIERPDGRIVDFLLDHGVVVDPVNPKALDRARDRFRQSGAKSDPFDARVLAGFLRTDHAHLRALPPSSEAAQELKLLTEDCQRHIRQQTRLVNQLTATLKAYYPRALEIAELTSVLAREFLQAYPTPEAVTALTTRQWQRWARAHRLSEARTRELWDVLQQPQLPVPAHVVRAKARLMQALVAELMPVVAAVGHYREAIEDFFASPASCVSVCSLSAGWSCCTLQPWSSWPSGRSTTCRPLAWRSRSLTVLWRFKVPHPPSASPPASSDFSHDRWRRAAERDAGSHGPTDGSTGRAGRVRRTHARDLVAPGDGEDVMPSPSTLAHEVILPVGEPAPACPQADASSVPSAC